MEALIIGLATAFNLIILKWKFEHDRHADLALDVGAIIVLSWMFGGTMGGMVIAMVASAIISGYLLVNPPKWEQEEELNLEEETDV